MYALVARLLLRSAGSRLAGLASKKAIQGGAQRLGRAAFSVGKRVGARNVRRFLFQDLMVGGLSNSLWTDAEERASQTVNTTAWIMSRIIGAAAVRGVRNFALSQGGIRKMITRSSAFRTVQQGRTALRMRRDSSLIGLRKEHQAIRSGVNTRTGEIGGQLGFTDRLYNANVWTRMALRDPVTKPQQAVRGMATGFGRQVSGTILFRNLIEREAMAPIVWGLETTHNLDEVWLPPTDANTPYTKSELAIQAFNAGTVYEGQYGLRRVRRDDMINVIRQQSRLGNNPASYLHSLFGTEGYGRVVGALIAREAQQVLGEEEKIQSAYAARYYNQQRKEEEESGGGAQESNQYRIGPKRVWVSQHTRGDGTTVRGHWRTVS